MLDFDLDACYLNPGQADSNHITLVCLAHTIMWTLLIHIGC